MCSFCQVHDGGSRRRQPEVAHLDDLLPIDGEVMTARHGLPHIEQQRIVALLGDVEGSREGITLSHLPFAPFRRGNIHHFARSLAFAAQQGHGMVGWIPLHQTVVVPKQSIAFVRQHHGHADLRVHLCEPSGQPPDIGKTVLKLSQTKETFIRWRRDGQRCHASRRITLQ